MAAHKTARFFACCHIVIGLLLILPSVFILSFRNGYYGLWIGPWALITGSLGIHATSRMRTSPNKGKALTGVYLGFSFTSAVLGGIIIIVFFVSIDPKYNSSCSMHPDNSLLPFIIVMLLGIAELMVGILSTIWSCRIVYGCCHTTSPRLQFEERRQMFYSALNHNMPNSGGYITTQGPGVVPMAVPVQGGRGLIAVRLPPYEEAIGSYPRVSPASGAQPQMVQMPPSGAMGSYLQVEPVSGATRGEPQSVRGVSTSDVVMEADELLLVQMPPSGAMGSYPQVEPVSGATGGESQSVQGVASSDPALGADELLSVQMPSDETGQYKVMSYV